MAFTDSDGFWMRRCSGQIPRRAVSITRAGMLAAPGRPGSSAPTLPLTTRQGVTRCGQRSGSWEHLDGLIQLEDILSPRFSPQQSHLTRSLCVGLHWTKVSLQPLNN